MCGLGRHAEEKLDQFSTLQQRGKLCSTALGPWSWWLCRRSQWWCDKVTDYLECSSLVAMLAVASLAGPAAMLVPVMSTDTDLTQSKLSSAPSLKREVTDHPPHPPGNLSSPRAPLSPNPKTDAAIVAADVKQGLLTLFVLLVVAAMIGSLTTTDPPIDTISDPNSYPTTVDCVPSWSPWTSCPKSCSTGIKTLQKGLGPPFPFTLLKYAALATTADHNAFPAAAPLLQMGTHAAVLPQTISDPAPPALAHQSRSPHEAGALASNVLPQTASNSAPSARYAAQVSTTMVRCNA